MGSNAPEKPDAPPAPPCGAYPQPIYPSLYDQPAPVATGQPIFTQQPFGAPPAPAPYQFPPSPTFTSPPAVIGMKVGPPRANPQPGMVIIGWEITPRNQDVGCCKCETLSTTGWIVVIILAICFWPLAFIPCLMDDCHEPQQRPIYGYPNQPSAGPPVGATPPAVAP